MLSVFIQTLACSILLMYVFSINDHSDSTLRLPDIFYKIGTSQSAISDKFTTHQYSEIYGTFLLSYVYQQHKFRKAIKFLEIGMGCKMDYGPGASVQLWKRIMDLRSDEIWEAEMDAKCVEATRKDGKLEGVRTLIGDQANKHTVKAWINETGGNFDVIVDDGGHIQEEIFFSFEQLWHTLLPGGLYFIEDLHVSRIQYDDSDIVFIDVIHSWMEELVMGIGSKIPGLRTSNTSNPIPIPPIPQGMKWIVCQHEMCLLAKCDLSAASNLNAATKSIPSQATAHIVPEVDQKLLSPSEAHPHAQSHKRTNVLLDPHGKHEAFLLSYAQDLRKIHKYVKLLELGVGAGVGLRQSLWKQLLNHKQDETWKVERDENCVRRAGATGLLDGARGVLAGDPANHTVVEGWVAHTGGHFNVVVDTGSVASSRLGALERLWPHVAPGGLYFMKNLKTARSGERGSAGVHVADLMHSWTEEMVIGRGQRVPGHEAALSATIPPIPQGVKWIMCQHEMCLLAKCDLSAASNLKCNS